MKYADFLANAGPRCSPGNRTAPTARRGVLGAVSVGRRPLEVEERVVPVGVALVAARVGS
jgi:hypothetical protein